MGHLWTRMCVWPFVSIIEWNVTEWTMMSAEGWRQDIKKKIGRQGRERSARKRSRTRLDLYSRFDHSQIDKIFSLCHKML